MVDFPRLGQPGNTQVGYRESGEARFRLRADAGGAFVANFTAGAG